VLQDVTAVRQVDVAILTDPGGPVLEFLSWDVSHLSTKKHPTGREK
jgi:hypothetical protein